MPEPKAPPAPAPPAAPTPAPSPAPPPSPTPSPPPAPTPDENPFAEIDAIVAAADKPRAATGDKPPSPAPAPSPPAAPAAPAKPAAKPGGARDPKELRQELETVKAELETRTKSYGELERKLKDFEARGKDTTALVERMTALEKQMADKDAEIRSLKQEASPEFKEKYDKPFNRLAAKAESVIDKMQVEEEATGVIRKATWGEFSKIYYMDEFTATREAKKLFGDDGGAIAMRYYGELHRLDDERSAALADERAQAQAKAQEEDGKRVQAQEKINETWTKVNKELSETVEDYRDPPEDTELSQARQQGYAVYDAPPKTLQQKIVKDAHIRQRVAAFGPNRLTILRQKREIEDLKAQLEELKNPQPGKGKRPGGTTEVQGDESWEQGLRKHMSQS